MPNIALLKNGLNLAIRARLPDPKTQTHKHDPKQKNK